MNYDLNKSGVVGQSHDWGLLEYTFVGEGIARIQLTSYLFPMNIIPRYLRPNDMACIY
jgi:hypothetical protein